MRLAVCLLLLFVAPAVQAQMYKCTEGGKTRYSDKPISDCKSPTTIAAPPASSAPSAAGKTPQSPNSTPPVPQLKGATKDKKGPPSPQQQVAKTPAASEHDKKYANARCRELKEEQAWLLSARGAKVEKRDERLGQVRQSLAACR